MKTTTTTTTTNKTNKFLTALSDVVYISGFVALLVFTIVQVINN